MSLNPVYFCNNCGLTQPKATSTLKTCTRCRMVKYCNAECQKADRPFHKNDCHPLRAYFSDELDNEMYLNYLLDIYIIQARKNQDYYGFERVIEIFNVEEFTSHEEYGATCWSVLAESYMNLGLNDQAAEAMEKAKAHPQLVKLAINILF